MRMRKEKGEGQGEGEGQEAPYNWLTPDHPPLAAFTGMIYIPFFNYVKGWPKGWG